MYQFYTLTLVFIFFILAILHFLWSLNILWGFESALPRKKDGSFLFYPKRIESFLVGLALSFLSGFYFSFTGFVPLLFDSKVYQIGCWFTIVIFGIRAIGDFNYVGFTKRIKNKEFAYWDTILYSPLCLFISLLAYLVERGI
ncbi:DUF3995 domain-containing protein [Leptospira vanthielii]|uniref:PF13160 family protein n=1 Tax=Leptospira vanthielii serovar Holland str. Waz Holland = ATCC 700522 TaxID=1218591 RepID=N1WDJ3_9LEPT|nr:DUF3995 domain-containing protein [Leptospira vanthielii]EMY71460.1 PF13160 family protein [Leptospira vanthielii serovar Holland str. Waz Holland = ATCC 700522]